MLPREATQVQLAKMTAFSRSLIEFEQRFGGGAASAQYCAGWPDGFGCSSCYPQQNLTVL